MENVDYVKVNTDENSDDNTAVKWKFVVRQTLICSTVWTNFFTLGLCVGSTTVIVPQFRRDANSTDIISPEMASWLSSSYSYCGTVYVLLLTILPKFLGRKSCFLLVSLIALVGFIILYVSTTVTHLFISVVMHGILFGSYITISIMIITEYSSPRYRGIFLTAKSASYLWGIWISNCIGTFFHWKYIAILGIVATVYVILTMLVWPESPLWLASKGKFAQCVKSHRWLKGNTTSSEKELEELIKYYKNSERIFKEEGNESVFTTNIFKIIFKENFYKPLLLAMLVNCLYNSNGKTVCTIYAIDVIKSITNSESSSYTGMLILDGVTIIGAYIGSGASKIVRRRIFLLSTTATGILFLFLLSLYMYLVNFNIIADNVYVSLLILSLYSLTISSGPMILSSSLISELIPLTHRHEFAFVIGIFSTLSFGTCVKIAPYLFTLCGLAGSFLFYVVVSTMFSVLIYKFLPETKDKTLLEVEKLIIGKQ